MFVYLPEQSTYLSPHLLLYEDPLVQQRVDGPEVTLHQFGWDIVICSIAKKMCGCDEALAVFLYTLQRRGYQKTRLQTQTRCLLQDFCPVQILELLGRWYLKQPLTMNQAFIEQ